MRRIAVGLAALLLTSVGLPSGASAQGGDVGFELAGVWEPNSYRFLDANARSDNSIGNLFGGTAGLTFDLESAVDAPVTLIGSASYSRGTVDGAWPVSFADNGLVRGDGRWTATLQNFFASGIAQYRIRLGRNSQLGLGGGVVFQKHTTELEGATRFEGPGGQTGIGSFDDSDVSPAYSVGLNYKSLFVRVEAATSATVGDLVKAGVRF